MSHSLHLRTVFTLLLLSLGLTNVRSWGQSSQLIGDREALFTPLGYNVSTRPPLAFVSSLQPIEDLPASWDLSPEFKADGDQFVATLQVASGTSLYGTGEVTGSLLRNGKTIKLWNTDNFNYLRDGGSRLYQSDPWVLGVRKDGSSFGVIFDATTRSTLLTSDDRIVFSSEGGPFRVVVIERSSPMEVVRVLSELTGKMPLPPLWALGFHQCRYSYYPDAKVREIAQEFRNRKLPCDVIWMDIHYMNGYRIFTFDPARFPNPKATNDFLHQLGFHSVWMIDPGVKVDPGYSVYDSGNRINAWVENDQKGPFQGKVWPGMCVFPDFTMPSVRDWWAGLYKGFLSQGVDGVWNDMNEPAVFEGPDGTMPITNLHRGGGDLPPGTHSLYHNVFGMLMVSASRQGILEANPDKRPFVLSRANFLGGQRYAAAWTGDNRADFSYLQESIPMSLNLGLSGQPLSGPDIGGYAGPITPELYAEWISMEPFYPFSRAHTAVENPPREPWVFGPKIEQVARTALTRRYKLLPYLYTLAYESSVHGDPIMRPVFFADPQDLSLRAEDQAFLEGDDLLVIPQWAQNVQLPQGDWPKVQLLEDSSEDDGYQATLRIKPGSIIPIGPSIEKTSDIDSGPLTLLVCLDKKQHAEGLLYQDSGEGFSYQKGDYLLSHFEASVVDGKVQVQLKDKEGNYTPPKQEIKIKVVNPPSGS